MTTNDIDAIRREWLRQCGACDAGLLIGCTCPSGDVRSVLSALCDEIEQLRAYAETTRYHQRQHTEAVREIERLRAEREHMELHPTGTVEWLRNRVNELTADLKHAQRQALTEASNLLWEWAEEMGDVGGTGTRATRKRTIKACARKITPEPTEDEIRAALAELLTGMADRTRREVEP